jgi:hypothetical protein
MDPSLELLDSAPDEGGDDVDPQHLLAHGLLECQDLGHKLVSVGRLGS